VVRLVKTWVLTSHNTLVYRRAFMSEFDCDYLILGAGAVGCVFGGLLSKAGKKVQLINSTSETSKAVKKNGLILELDKKTIHCFPKTGLPVEALNARVVMVFTKTHQTLKAIKGVIPNMSLKTTYLTLQNGLGNANTLSKLLPKSPILYGVTMLPATLLKPGHVKSEGKNHTWFGSENSADIAISKVIHQDLKLAGFDIELVKNPALPVWQKACFNVAMNGVSALINGPPGLIEAYPELKTLVHELADEAIRVAVAKMINIDAQKVHELIDFACSKHKFHKPSMLQDIQSGRTTEIDSLNGFILREAENLNIQAPINRLVYHLILAREEAGSFWQQKH
jgi:2-dehydropantoate 2-reductase